MTPYVNMKMSEFIENGGFIGDKKLHVRKFKSPSKSKKPSYPSSKEELKLDSKSKSTQFEDSEAESMTPKERMMYNKKKQAEEKAKELAGHARDAIGNYSAAKKKLNEEFSTSGYQKGKQGDSHKSF